MNTQGKFFSPLLLFLTIFLALGEAPAMAAGVMSENKVTMSISQELTPGESCLAPVRAPALTSFALDADASGVIQTINNIVNLTVVSRDANDLKAEYRAGFVQGKLQGTAIRSARDNCWDNAYLTDPSHNFPKQKSPTSWPVAGKESGNETKLDPSLFLDSSSAGDDCHRVVRI